MNEQLFSAATDLKRMADRPFEDAVAMPPSVYTSLEFLARELQRLHLAGVPRARTRRRLSHRLDLRRARQYADQSR